MCAYVCVHACKSKCKYNSNKEKIHMYMNIMHYVSKDKGIKNNLINMIKKKKRKKKGISVHVYGKCILLPLSCLLFRFEKA